MLYPGSLLPLHIFEERYRRMVSELLDQANGRRRFGVVAIKAGREAWDDGFSELHDVGCTAVLQRVEAYSDGRYDILAIGESRFRVDTLDTSSDLVCGTVTTLEDSCRTGDRWSWPGEVGRLFGTYVEALRSAGGILSDDDTDDLPPSPTALSYAVADGMILDLGDKQALLAAGSTDERLTLELEYLHREAALVRAFAMRPGVELHRVPYSTN